jgi:predicted ArsR family transcriptional regulator
MYAAQARRLSILNLNRHEARLMHSTKTEILAFLKRSDGATVDELSTALGLASMTVRQHLTALERDEMVSAQEVRRATGRPHFLYRLTESGHRTLAEGYDRLVALLVESAGRLEPGAPGDVRRHLFRLAAASLAERHRGELRPLATALRAERAVAILRAHGGFAEYHFADGVAEVRDFGCVFRSTVGGGGPCDWHETFLAALFETAVECAQPSDGCATCCSYVIPQRASAVMNRGTP